MYYGQYMDNSYRYPEQSATAVMSAAAVSFTFTAVLLCIGWIMFLALPCSQLCEMIKPPSDLVWHVLCLLISMPVCIYIYMKMHWGIPRIVSHIANTSGRVWFGLFASAYSCFEIACLFSAAIIRSWKLNWAGSRCRYGMKFMLSDLPLARVTLVTI